MISSIHTRQVRAYAKALANAEATHLPIEVVGEDHGVAAIEKLFAAPEVDAHHVEDCQRQFGGDFSQGIPPAQVSGSNNLAKGLGSLWRDPRLIRQMVLCAVPQAQVVAQ